MRGVKCGRWVDGVKLCALCGLYPLLLGIAVDNQEAAVRLIEADGLAVDGSDFVMLTGVDFEKM